MNVFFRCAAFVLAGLALSAAPVKELKTWHVEIEALGQANSKSQGDEVWVYEVRTPQEVLDWNNIQQTGAKPWEFRPRPNASGGRAALATGGGKRLFKFVVHGDSLAIKMVKHSWSGRVKLTVNGEVRIADLYSADEPSFVVESFGENGLARPPVFAPKPHAARSSTGSSTPALVGGALFLSILIWTAWRRSGNAPMPGARSQPGIWFDRTIRRAWVSVLAAIPASLVFARIIFGAPGASLGAFAFVLAFLYSFGLFFGILTFCRLCRIREMPGLDRTTKPDWQSYLAVAVTVSAIAATVVVVAGEDRLNNQHAYWMKLLIQTTSSQPPQLAVRYGNAPDEVEYLHWQPVSQAILSFRRLSAMPPSKPIQIDQLVSDGESKKIDDLTVHGGIAYHDVITLAAPDGGMLRWPGIVRRLSFRISGNPERIRAYWLDQVRDIDVGPIPQVVSFNLGGSYQGWALLPPNEIDSLLIESPATQVEGYLIDGHIFSQPEQMVRLNDARLMDSGANRLTWPQFKAINVRRPGVFAFTWLCIFVGTMLALFGCFQVSRCFSRARWLPSFDLLLNHPAIPPGDESTKFFRTALPVWAVCVLYHLAFVFSVGVGFTNDSVGYYDMARQFIGAPYLQDIVVERTPGYPLFIATMIWIFGDAVWDIALVQHLALAALSLVTMWCLWDRLPRKWVAAVGLLAGISPAVTPMANLLWTEALYCTFSSSALLFAACSRRHSTYMVWAGLCAGAATMLRPNGLLVMCAIGGYILLDFFWQRGRRPLRYSVVAGSLLTSAYLIVTAPWYMHLEVNHHTLTLGKGLKEFGSWAGYVFQRQLPVDLAINRPDRAIYAVPGAYHDEPYVADSEFPLIKGNDTIYYRETEREWFASQSLAPYLEDLKYNATLVWRPVDLRFEFKEIRWFIEGWMRPDVRVTASGSKTQRLLSDLTNRRPVSFQFARILCLEFSKFVLDHWIYLAFFSSIGVLSCLVWHWPLSIAMFVGASVFAFSTNLVPGERYIAVLEPLYYVLAIHGIHVLWVIAVATLTGAARTRKLRIRTS